MFGASLSEIALVVVLLGIVLLAPLAPKIGAAVGGLFEKQGAGGSSADTDPDDPA